MIKRFSMLAVAAALALALSTPGYASTIIVTEDSGGGTVDVHGTATGATVTTDSYADDVISSVSPGPTPAGGFILKMDYSLTGPNSTTVTGGEGTKTFSYGTDLANSVTLTFTISSGFASGSHLNADGTITGIGANHIVSAGGNDYDFSGLVGGGISLSNDKVGTNFATVFHHAGTSALASGGGVHEAAVPEPASMALLGIGMTGLLAFRRLLRRVKV
jgi:hypothetical protein